MVLDWQLYLELLTMKEDVLLIRLTTLIGFHLCKNNGWQHSMPDSDPVHFDYTSAKDIRSQNLKAFQKLWNKHNSNKIAEDGQYGPDTENALYHAPCDGW